jgi:hypothetical protein
MREAHGYVIGMVAPGADRSTASYYVEGFGISPTWTYRQSANRYSNKRDAIRKARKLASVGRTVFVETYVQPCQGGQPVWISK